MSNQGDLSGVSTSNRLAVCATLYNRHTHAHKNVQGGEEKRMRAMSAAVKQICTLRAPPPPLCSPRPPPCRSHNRKFPQNCPFLSLSITSKPFVENNFPPDIILLYILFMMTAQCFKKYKFIISIFGSWSNISSLQYR